MALLVQGLLLGALALNEPRSREAEQGALRAQVAIAQAEALSRELILKKERLNAALLGGDPPPAGRSRSLAGGIAFFDARIGDGSARARLARDFLATVRAFQTWLANAERMVQAGRTGEAVRLAGIEGDGLQHELLAKLGELEAAELRLSREEGERLRNTRRLSHLLMGAGLSTLLATLLLARPFPGPGPSNGEVTEASGRRMDVAGLGAAGDGPDSAGVLRLTAERLTKTLQMREAALQEIAEELAAANRELRAKADDMEAFIRGVSHDLRTPLINIKGFNRELELSCDDLLRLLATAALPPATRSRLDAIDKEIREAVYYLGASVASADRILAALRQLARAGHRHFEWQILDVHEIVTRSVEALHATIVEKGAEVVVHALPEAWGDAIAMEQIFSNLLKNALAYLDPDRSGRVEIGADTGTPGASITYWMRDNGVGIPAERLATIFIAFQRIRSDLAEGEGIGLALVHRSVSRLGGQIRVESHEGVGSTFFVTLKAGRDRRPTPLPFPPDSRSG